MTTLKDVPTTLMFHAEMIPPITDSVGDDVQTSLPPLSPSGPLTSYSTFLDSRPPAFETYAIEEILSLTHLAPSLHLHIVHLSAIEAIPILRKARNEGVKITAETCFHYLALAAEEVADGDTRHKCCPPIRSSVNRDGLWNELSNPDSVIQTIVSDHSPCTPELKLLPDNLKNSPRGGGATHAHAHGGRVKGVNGELLSAQEVDEKERGDFFASWGGISSVGLGLPILWTEMHNRSRSSRSSLSSPSSSNPKSSSSDLTILDITRLCSLRTAAQVGLSHRKGALRPGLDADICVFDAEGSWKLGKEEMLFRNKVSPYQGRTLRGVVRETWVRGRKVFERARPEGQFLVGKEGVPTGRLLLERRVL